MSIRSRGFARSDLMAVITCSVLLIAMASVVFGQDAKDDRAGGGVTMHTKTRKDAEQLRMMHQSFLVFAREFQGIMPLPGLIDRLPFNGVEEPGRGPEDEAQNTTANLHSAMIMQNFYTPDLIISPVERNPKVKVHADYNYEMYNPTPAVDCYWDANFKADLAQESNVSYANLVLFGKRKSTEWRDTLNAKFAILGNRGPKDGKNDPDSFTCGPHGNWAGNIAGNDNHAEFFTATQSPHTFKNAEGQEKPDNFFAIDDGMGGADVILSFTKAITKDGAELQWD
jgi:hypothetical protein